jgi:hypothetical protein
MARFSEKVKLSAKATVPTMLGYATAKAVSQDAFDSAMADLLSSLSAVSITWVLSQSFADLHS